jgi:hypothetical protein
MLMAKYKRIVVGSIVKSKNVGEPDYVKLRGDMAEELIKALIASDKTKGLTLSLESKKNQLERLEKAVADGKLKPEHGDSARERISKIPDYVRFEIVLVNKSS